MAGVTPHAAPISPQASASSMRIASALADGAAAGSGAWPFSPCTATPTSVTCALTVACLSSITCYDRVARLRKAVARMPDMITMQRRADDADVDRYIRRSLSGAIAAAVGLLAAAATLLVSGSMIGFVGIPIPGRLGG